jgi:Tfp pilus assembly protein PilF
MGVVLSKMRKGAESQEAFKKAAALNPGASAQNFYNIGATLVNSGKTAEAAESFRQAITADRISRKPIINLVCACRAEWKPCPAR